MGFKYRILVVDDEPLIRQTSAMVLASNGYEVRTAGDGFEALIELRQALPDLIISDLSMPNMSGFELLSVVRRRFPEIPVIAITGKFDGTMPVGLIADSYFSKSHYTPEELFESIARLIEHGPIRPHVEKVDKAPVWIPRNGKDSNGIPYIVITCTECLRSFPLNVTKEQNPEVLETLCLFCSSTVKYIIDFSLSVTSPARGLSAPIRTTGIAS